LFFRRKKKRLPRGTVDMYWDYKKRSK